MIDRQVFADQLARLALIYPGTTLNTPMIEEYNRILGGAMETEEFVGACEALRRSPSDEFFPRPARILELGSPDLGVGAAAEWTGALKSSSWASKGRESINTYPFSRRGRFAWDSIGGARRVGNADERDLDFLRREFIRHYMAATPDALERVERELPGRRNARQTFGDAIGAIKVHAQKALGEVMQQPEERPQKPMTEAKGAEAHD